MGSLLNYGRGARVTLWRPQPAAFFSTPDAANGIQIEGLRIQFEITHSAEKEPNKCQIIVNNAGPATRAFATTRPIAVRLEAGYGGDLQHLFVGDLRWGQSKLEGVDWLTTLDIADGDRAYRLARVAESFRSGSTVQTVLIAAAESLQVRLPDSVRDDPALNVPYASGAALFGSTRDILSRVLAPLGYDWDLTGGQLRIQRQGAALAGPLLIAAANGLIGTPETAAPDKPGKQPITTIRTLLDPRLLPKQQIQLQTRDLAGLFRIQSVKHSGDTHGGDFQTEIEATPL